MSKPLRKNTACTLTILIISAVLLFQSGNTLAGDNIIITPISNKIEDGWMLRGMSFFSNWTIGNARINDSLQNEIIASPSGTEPPELINVKKGIDIFTNKAFGDCIIELEVMVPRGSNSGIYLMGQYELQVRDSYGKTILKDDDMGGIYGYAPPKINAAARPGTWQNFRINFKAPRFSHDKNTRICPAEFIEVTLNGKVIHKNVKMEKGPTEGPLRDGEFTKGPLMLQGYMGPVSYRNIRIFIPADDQIIEIPLKN